MKKSFTALFILALFAQVAFAQEGAGLSGADTIKVYSIVSAAVGLAIAAFAGALSIGYVASTTITGMARNPGVGGKLTTTMYIAIALIEAQVIYTLVIALILLFANPLL